MSAVIDAATAAMALSRVVAASLPISNVPGRPAPGAVTAVKLKDRAVPSGSFTSIWNPSPASGRPVKSKAAVVVPAALVTPCALAEPGRPTFVIVSVRPTILRPSRAASAVGTDCGAAPAGLAPPTGARAGPATERAAG